jgi:hypothetical protein
MSASQSQGLSSWAWAHASSSELIVEYGSFSSSGISTDSTGVCYSNAEVSSGYESHSLEIP